MRGVGGHSLPADDGRGSTFYVAAMENRKKLLQQTTDNARGAGSTSNVQLFGEKFFSSCLRPLTLTGLQGRGVGAGNGGLGAVAHNAHNEVHFSYSKELKSCLPHERLKRAKRAGIQMSHRNSLYTNWFS